MGIKTPTQLVSTLAKTFAPVIGIVVELRRDRQLATRLSGQRNSLTIKFFYENEKK
jgi:hypothetical protein